MESVFIKTHPYIEALKKRCHVLTPADPILRPASAYSSASLHYAHYGIFACVTIVLLMLATFFYPASSFLLFFILMNGLYTVTLLYKALLFMQGEHYTYPTTSSKRYADEELPIYSVLLPVYKESAILPTLLANIDALDYPKEKLDVLLIIEADDIETMNAAASLALPAYIQLVLVPFSHPRTKPKACNSALSFAKGKYITIYDAEDRPAPDQLRRMVAQFEEANPKVDCIQARLNFYNAESNLLAKWFSLEYSMWFNYLLPGLKSMGGPTPLGGTSNHFVKDTLLSLGGWDPYNVTEDAELGLRFAVHEVSISLSENTTLEEAPSTLYAWLKQRSRWIKGYLQTYVAYLRHHRLLKQQGGLQTIIGLHFFIGAPCLVFLLSPFLWGAWALVLFGQVSLWLPPGCTQWAFGNLLLTLLLHFYIAGGILLRKSHWRTYFTSALTFPLYWFLHSIASYKALTEFFLSPFYWDKTSHGKSVPNTSFSQHLPYGV